MGRIPKIALEPHALTAREKAFIEEFLKNGRHVAKAYVSTCTQPGTGDPNKPSTRTKSQAYARRPRVKAAIEAADREVAERARRHIAEKYGATQEKVIEELARMAFSNVTDVTTWDENGIKTKTSNELDDAAKSAVVDVVETKNGVRVKMADKQKALESLGKALGIFKEEKQSGPTLAVQFVIEGK